MKLSVRYGSHLPVLMKLMPITSGEVLELGMGAFSTPYLHYACLLSGRKLTSYENDKGWMKWFVDYHCELHQVHYVESWDLAEIERPWDVALVDHSPDYRRIQDIARLAEWAKYIVIHDSERKWEHVYHYSSIWPTFKYRKSFMFDGRGADVVSNYYPVMDL